MNNFDLKDIVDLETYNADVKISNDLNKEFSDQAMLYVYYASIAAQARKEYDTVSLALETAKAKVDLAIREDALKKGEKLTENKVSSMVQLHPQVQSLVEKRNEAREMLEVTQAMCKGFEQRKDMLIQRGAFERQERNGEMRMSSVSSKEDQTSRLVEALSE